MAPDPRSRLGHLPGPGTMAGRRGTAPRTHVEHDDPALADPLDEIPDGSPTLREGVHDLPGTHSPASLPPTRRHAAAPTPERPARPGPKASLATRLAPC